MIILKNTSDTEDLLIPDLGVVLLAGSLEQFVEGQEKSKVKNSLDVRRFALEDTPKLVINDGTKDIAPEDVDTFLDSASAFRDYPRLASRDSSDTSLVYVGRADSEAAESDPVWQIYRISLDQTDIKEYADGDTNFDNVWDHRESLTYS